MLGSTANAFFGNSDDEKYELNLWNILDESINITPPEISVAKASKAKNCQNYPKYKTSNCHDNHFINDTPRVLDEDVYAEATAKQSIVLYQEDLYREDLYKKDILELAPLRDKYSDFVLHNGRGVFSVDGKLMMADHISKEPKELFTYPEVMLKSQNTKYYCHSNISIIIAGYRDCSTIYEDEDKNNPMQGLLKTNLGHTYQYIDGVRHGKAVSTWKGIHTETRESDIKPGIYSVTYYKDGVMNGPYRTWWNNGFPRSYMVYKDGDVVGKPILFDPNGERLTYFREPNGERIIVTARYTDQQRHYSKFLEMMELRGKDDGLYRIPVAVYIERKNNTKLFDLGEGYEPAVVKSYDFTEILKKTHLLEEKDGLIYGMLAQLPNKEDPFTGIVELVDVEKGNGRAKLGEDYTTSYTSYLRSITQVKSGKRHGLHIVLDEMIKEYVEGKNTGTNVYIKNRYKLANSEIPDSIRHILNKEFSSSEVSHITSEVVDGVLQGKLDVWNFWPIEHKGKRKYNETYKSKQLNYKNNKLSGYSYKYNKPIFNRDKLISWDGNIGDISIGDDEEAYKDGFKYSGNGNEYLNFATGELNSVTLYDGGVLKYREYHSSGLIKDIFGTANLNDKDFNEDMIYYFPRKKNKYLGREQKNDIGGFAELTDPTKIKDADVSELIKKFFLKKALPRYMNCIHLSKELGEGCANSPPNYIGSIENTVTSGKENQNKEKIKLNWEISNYYYNSLKERVTPGELTGLSDIDNHHRKKAIERYYQAATSRKYIDQKETEEVKPVSTRIININPLNKGASCTILVINSYSEFYKYKTLYRKKQNYRKTYFIKENGEIIKDVIFKQGEGCVKVKVTHKKKIKKDEYKKIIKDDDKFIEDMFSDF